MVSRLGTVRRNTCYLYLVRKLRAPSGADFIPKPPNYSGLAQKDDVPQSYPIRRLPPKSAHPRSSSR